MRYKETESRNSVTRDFGGRREVRIKIPVNTCHADGKYSSTA
jgi:hypothetical protein